MQSKARTIPRPIAERRAGLRQKPRPPHPHPAYRGESMAHFAAEAAVLADTFTNHFEPQHAVAAERNAGQFGVSARWSSVNRNRTLVFFVRAAESPGDPGDIEARAITNSRNVHFRIISRFSLLWRLGDTASDCNAPTLSWQRPAIHRGPERWTCCDPPEHLISPVHCSSFTFCLVSWRLSPARVARGIRGRHEKMTVCTTDC